MNLEEERKLFIRQVYDYADEYPDEMLQEFCDFWTKKVTYKGKIVLRFQTQFQFYMNLRLINWKRSGQPGKTKEQQRQKLELQKERFRVRVFTFSTEYDTKLLQDFYDYWSETNAEGTAMRWQKQKTFNLNLRLKT